MDRYARIVFDYHGTDPAFAWRLIRGEVSGAGESGTVVQANGRPTATSGSEKTAKKPNRPRQDS